MKNIIFILLVLSCFQAQTIKFNIFGEHQISKNSKVYLFSISGEKFNPIDSTSFQNTISFVPKTNLTTGLYRLILPNRKHIDFIYSKEDVEINTEININFENIKVIQSENNKLFYQYVKITRDFKNKTELLSLLLQRYPKDDNFYKEIENKLNNLQNEYIEFVYSTSQINPDSFIAKYIKSAHLPIVNYKLEYEKQIEELKRHSLDNLNFSDVSLINSDLFTNRTIEYLMYYRNPQLPKDLLEKEFIKAVDTLITKAKINEQVYKHIVEYLVDGFRRFGFENVLNYIVDNFVIKDDLCLDEKISASIDRRVRQNKMLPVGTKASNFELNNEKGKKYNLYESKADKKLIIFYASWCPHCKDLLKELSSIQNVKKVYEIIAVSIDNKKEDWIKFIEENKFSFINLWDEMGWEGKTAEDYYIYATPTMFLVDKENKIISKPMTFTELGKL